MTARSSSRILAAAALLLVAIAMPAPHLLAADHSVASPDGRNVFIVSNGGGLSWRAEVGGKPVVAASSLGLVFKDGVSFGPQAKIVGVEFARHSGSWTNPCGKRRVVPEDWSEMRVSLREGETGQPFGLIVRASNDGLAFRYDLPLQQGREDFVLKQELTEFRFAADHRCWIGSESICAESTYDERPLSKIPVLSGAKGSQGKPFLGVLPLLVQTPECFVAVAESDLLDWAGMFLSGSGEAGVKVALAEREDGNGAVVSTFPRRSPWRVLMIGKEAGDLIESDLIDTLATPSRLGHPDWIKPGISAWDAWWAGTNPSQPKFKGLESRGDTRSHFEYIDFAAEMGWPYQLVDWFWYKDDLSKPLPHVDLPAVFKRAEEKNVRLFVWMHSKDLKAMGEDKAFEMVAGWGAAGVKIDFMESDSQETVQWYERTLETAARHGLMVVFHGCYKPTGLARTYPNYITQEGVLGNESNKYGKNQCTPGHTVMLPFTRGLLGPMDFTPGGFLNRAEGEWSDASPAQVIGTRARQLAMGVVYFSPLLVLCDSPANYRGQPGLEFYRGLPTVWDETLALRAEPGKVVALARRSGDRWYLGAMNGAEPATLELDLGFLGDGRWTARSFSDKPGGRPFEVVEERAELSASDHLDIRLEAAGGFAAVFERN
jgi:alpha-glucosidase